LQRRRTVPWPPIVGLDSGVRRKAGETERAYLFLNFLRAPRVFGLAALALCFAGGSWSDEAEIPAVNVLIEESGYLRLEVTEQPLRLEKHKLHFETAETGEEYLDLIDRKLPHGTDGWVPRREIVAVEICWGSEPYRLSRADFGDLFEGRPAGISVEGNNLYFSISGGDGSASYSANFEISRSTLQGTRVVYDVPDENPDDPAYDPDFSQVRLIPMRKDWSNPCSRRDEEAWRRRRELAKKGRQ